MAGLCQAPASSSTLRPARHYPGQTCGAVQQGRKRQLIVKSCRECSQRWSAIQPPRTVGRPPVGAPLIATAHARDAQGVSHREGDAGPNNLSGSHRPLVFTQDDLRGGTDANANAEPGQQAAGDASDEHTSAGVKAALAALRWYKGVISPLLPNSCRFQPTCSVYSMEAYKRYGVAKGTALTAWRLLRCNPFNGNTWKYDPPKWPPVGLEFAFNSTAVAQDDSSPEA